jgi:hypothetical protein
MKPNTASEERGEQKTSVYMLLNLHQVQNLVIVRQVQYVLIFFLSSRSS